MELGEAIYREITGRSPRTEPSDFSDALDYLVGAFGSASSAARAIGVPPSSMRHWVSSGRLPKGGRGDTVIRAARQLERRARLSPRREEKMRQDGALDSIRMVGALTYDSAPEPERDVDLGAYMADVQNDLIDAYLEGASLDDLEAIFVDGITDPFYHDTLDPLGESRMSWDIIGLDGWR